MTLFFKKKNQLYQLFWYLVQFGFKNLFPLITLPIFTRYISLSEFGLYALAIFYAVIATGIINLGLSSIFERNFFEKNPFERKQLLWNIFFVVTIMFFVFVIITIELKHIISILIFNNHKLEKYLLIALCFQTFKSFNIYFLKYLKNYQSAQRFAYISIFESFASICLALVLVVFYSMNLYGFILGQAFGSFITFSFLFCITLFPFKYNINYSLIIDNLRLSLPLTPRIFFGAINSQFDRFMLGLLNSLGGVGLYDIGQKIANISFTYMTAVQNVFEPEVYKRLFSKDINIKKSVGRYLSPFFYISILICLFIAIFSLEILYILTPEEFHGASKIISILSLLYGFYFFGKQPQLLFAKKTGLISILSFISISLNIGFNIPMINYYGIIGAAFATLFAGIFSVGLSFYFGQKYAPIYYEKIIFIIIIYFIISVFSILFLSSLEIDWKIILMIKIFVFSFYVYLGYLYDIFKLLRIPYNENLKNVNQ